MIKLVASDIDGTMLEEGSDQINPEFFDVIMKLKEKGVIFAAASGRQYSSMKYVFAPIEKEMIFICENGANVICRGYHMSSTPMNQEDARALIRYFRPHKDWYPMVSTSGPIYVDTHDEAYLDRLINKYHNDVRLVEDLLAEDIEIIKIAIFREAGVAEIATSIMRDWEDKFRIAISGIPWIDFIDKKADKGNALKTICSILHITREETMAFGDNLNDIGMLKNAGVSYAVENASPEVKRAADHIAPANSDYGVLEVLKELLTRL